MSMTTASRVAAELLRVLPRKRISSAMGRLADVTGPTPLVNAAIRMFVRSYDVDLDEAIVPPEGFESFDDFFTRELKPGMRTIDQRADVVVSPADGRVEDLGPVESSSRFLVKGREYDVGELLESVEDGERFRGGTFFIVYLSPRDYHRVHAPVDGRVRYARHVDGTLYPVNSIGLQHVPRLFARNERVVVVQGSRFGDVATVMVGAIGVGRITTTFDPRIVTNNGKPAWQRGRGPRTEGSPHPGELRYGDVGPALARGGELGRFHLGSTAIVFLGPQHPFRFEIEAGTHVRMGQAIAVRDNAGAPAPVAPPRGREPV
jgi:phosphatidylserine decarboxylase